jgi:hypothetical protein
MRAAPRAGLVGRRGRRAGPACAPSSRDSHRTGAGTGHLGAMPPTLPSRHPWTAATAQWVPLQRRVCAPGPALERGQPHTSAPTGHTPGCDGAAPVVMHDESRLLLACMRAVRPGEVTSTAALGPPSADAGEHGARAPRPGDAQHAAWPARAPVRGLPSAWSWSARGLCDASLQRHAGTCGQQERDRETSTVAPGGAAPYDRCPIMRS